MNAVAAYESVELMSIANILVIEYYININTEYILMDDSNKIFRNSYTLANRPTEQKRPSDSL